MVVFDETDFIHFEIIASSYQLLLYDFSEAR